MTDKIGITPVVSKVPAQPQVAQQPQVPEKVANIMGYSNYDVSTTVNNMPTNYQGDVMVDGFNFKNLPSTSNNEQSVPGFTGKANNQTEYNNTSDSSLWRKIGTGIGLSAPLLSEIPKCLEVGCKTALKWKPLAVTSAIIGLGGYGVGAFIDNISNKKAQTQECQAIENRQNFKEQRFDAIA